MRVLNFRQYARVEVDIAIVCALPGSKEPLRAALNNVSEEGASLVAAAPLPIALSLEFDIKLPGIKDPAHVKAEVLWSREIREGGKPVFAHGLLFSRIDITDRQRLHEFISSSMSY